uniref:Uncharacterized protein n=2 Tax=Picea TaxID=3328 RepID=A0A117NHD1_PICGL|nr:hypothetical protein ABT39_MTgene5170 [Picea glauca]QHR91648.1 hypothetical protein Q903MT_gene5683 [Picea sitchensis]
MKKRSIQSAYINKNLRCLPYLFFSQECLPSLVRFVTFLLVLLPIPNVFQSYYVCNNELSSPYFRSRALSLYLLGRVHLSPLPMKDEKLSTA